MFLKGLLSKVIILKVKIYFTEMSHFVSKQWLFTWFLEKDIRGKPYSKYIITNEDIVACIFSQPQFTYCYEGIISDLKFDTDLFILFYYFYISLSNNLIVFNFCPYIFFLKDLQVWTDSVPNTVIN